jgi:16S rRNA C1402 N4-methylase RsmH
MLIERISNLCHTLLGHALVPGGAAIDATAGNGHDTLFLARGVGERGRVLAFDVQRAALDATRELLEREGLAGRVSLNLAGHERMAEVAGPVLAEAGLSGRVCAATFNLGYLPGGDRTLATRPETTCRALDAALELLAPEGLMTILAYTGHEGGAEEVRAVERHLEAISPRTAQVARVEMTNHERPEVRLLLVEKQR